MELNNKKLYYFAHPFTGYGELKPIIEEANYRKCIQRTCELIEKGFAVFAPILHSFPIERFSVEALKQDHQVHHAFFMKLDKTIISKTKFDGLILPPEWEDSVGCQIEHGIFTKAHKPILFYMDIINDKIKNK